MEQAIQEVADASAEHEVPSSGSEGGICLATKNTVSVPTSHSAGNVQKGMTRSSSENLLPRLEKTPALSILQANSVAESLSRRFEG